jgi:hypothetical protein
MTCLVLVVTAWAGDPWKEKTYKEWNESEANKILTDSPWARPLTVVASWRIGGKALADAASRRTGDAASPREPSGGISTDVTDSIGAQVGGATPGEETEARFILRWGSARTAREALARIAVLRGTPEAEAERLLHLPLSEHQFVLYGSDMLPFAKSDEMSLMEKTSLKLKKGKQAISPSRVEIRRGADGKKISGVVFYFSIKSAAGEPVIPRDEKSVEFECRVGNVIFRQSFDLQKMSSKAGPDWQ